MVRFLLALSLVALPQTVLAQTTYVDQLGRPAVRVNPGDVVTFDYGNSRDGQRQLNSIRSDACGLLILPTRNLTAQITSIDEELVYLGSTQVFGSRVLPMPRCVNGQLSEPRPDPFKLPDGRGVLPVRPDTIYFVSPRRLRRVRADACGLVVPRRTETYPNDSYTYQVNGGPFQSVLSADPPVVNLPYLPLCRQDKLYLPVPSITP